MTDTEREYQLATRFVATADKAVEVGVPIDMAARSLLSAATSLMLRRPAPAFHPALQPWRATMTDVDREYQLATRFVATADKAVEVGVPIDMAARSLLSAATSLMLRRLTPHELAHELHVLADRIDEHEDFEQAQQLPAPLPN